MKKLILGLVILLTSFSFNSCNKEENEVGKEKQITINQPVRTPAEYMHVSRHRHFPVTVPPGAADLHANGTHRHFDNNTGQQPAGISTIDAGLANVNINGNVDVFMETLAGMDIEMEPEPEPPISIQFEDVGYSNEPGISSIASFRITNSNYRTQDTNVTYYPQLLPIYRDSSGNLLFDLTRGLDATSTAQLVPSRVSFQRGTESFIDHLYFDRSNIPFTRLVINTTTNQSEQAEYVGVIGYVHKNASYKVRSPMVQYTDIFPRRRLTGSIKSASLLSNFNVIKSGTSGTGAIQFDIKTAHDNASRRREPYYVFVAFNYIYEQSAASYLQKRLKVNYTFYERIKILNRSGALYTTTTKISNFPKLIKTDKTGVYFRGKNRTLKLKKCIVSLVNAPHTKYNTNRNFFTVTNLPNLP